MFLKITVKQSKEDHDNNVLATDVGYLLHKNPFGKTLKFNTKYGDTFIFFNKNEPEECSFSMVLDIDSLDLFKKSSRGDIKQESLDHYVHNKSYVMSAIFTQALSKVFGTCMAGVCKDKPELVEHKWRVEVELATVQTNRIGETFLSRLFTDLNYTIELDKLPYDKEFEEWGLSNNYKIKLQHNEITIKDLMTQLYVLIPVINPDRHFFVDESTMNGLINKGGTWLSNHPLKEIIVKRYLVQDKELSNSALELLKTEEELNQESNESKLNKIPSETELEKKESLGVKRHNRIIELIKEHDYRTFVDFGCNDAKLIKRAITEENSTLIGDDDKYFKSIIGVDVAYRTLAYQERKLKQQFKDNKDTLNKINLVVSSLMYQDYRLKNQEVFVLSEVIEHIDKEKHDIVLDNIFNYYAPNLVIITTPNKEYNVVYDIPDNKLRHKDHRFEWTRKEFTNWCEDIQKTYKNYEIYETGFIGDSHEQYSGSCQYVVLTKKEYISRTVSDKLLSYNIPFDKGIRLDRLLNSKSISTRFNQSIEIKKENTLEPLHNLSRFSIPFEQLIYIPPTMSPVESGSHPEYLEYPTDAFKYFKDKGINTIICETKHMGSRMLTLICKTEYTAKNLFKLPDGDLGVSWTRSGYRFFNDKTTEKEVHKIFHNALTEADMWSQLKTEWILLDCEMMPWNYKGEYSLIVKQYADIGCSGLNTLQTSINNMKEYYDNNQINIHEDSLFISLFNHYNDRLKSINDYTEAYRKYIWKINSTQDLKIAPFHILATSKTVHDDKNHLWHLDTIDKFVIKDTTGVLVRTDYIAIDLNNESHIKQACDYWEEQTALGAEGMVIKPIHFLQKDKEGNYCQPAIKCRGKEYLRIIYGPEYTLPENMPRLRKRNVKKKRYLAMNEFLLGLEGLHRFTLMDSLESIHECIFGVLTLDAEPVDARL